MRQGNGAELLGAADPRSSSIGIIDVAPTDDREGVVAAILTQDKLGRKQIVVNLPAENKAFQRPIDFDGLKSMRRKLQAQLIVVAPGGSAPAEFARQRRFPVYSTKDNFARSLGAEPLQVDQQRRRNIFGAGRLRPVDDLPENAAPPVVPVPLPDNAPEPPASTPAFTHTPSDQEEEHDLSPNQPGEEDEDVALPPPIPFPMPPYPARSYNQPVAPPEDEQSNGSAPPLADGSRLPDPPDQDEDDGGPAPAFIPFPTPIPPVQPQMPSLSQSSNAGNVIGFPGAVPPVDASAAPPAPPYNPPPPTRRQRPPRKPPRRGLALLVAALLIVLLALIACGIFAYAAPGTFNALASHVIPASTGASVTITPKNQLLTDSFAIQAVTGKPSSANRQVQATNLTYTTPPSTKTVNATGKKQTPATYATGSLTFYNASGSVQVVLSDTVFNVNGGVQIENTEKAVIPAAHGSPPVEGAVTVAAKALTSGSVGNIPANTLYLQSCCGGPIVVSNAAAFTGGQNPQNYTYVQQSDVNTVVSALEPQLTTQAMSGFNGEKKAGQQLVAEPNCTTNNSANPPVGAKASSTTVTVTATCTGEVYDLNGADKLAQNLLANEAAKSPGKGYTLTGTIVTYPPRITSIQSNGTVDLVIKTAGVWVYQFTDAAKSHLAQLIAGKSQSEAQAILLQQPGVASVNISIANNGTTLPTDPTQIAITIQSIPGAPTPTVTVTPGPPITPIASPTEGNG